MAGAPGCVDNLFTYAGRWFGLCLHVIWKLESAFSLLHLTFKYINYNIEASKKPKKLSDRKETGYSYLPVLYLHSKDIGYILLSVSVTHMVLVIAGLRWELREPMMRSYLQTVSKEEGLGLQNMKDADTCPNSCELFWVTKWWRINICRYCYRNSSIISACKNIYHRIYS